MWALTVTEDITGDIAGNEVLMAIKEDITNDFRENIFYWFCHCHNQ